MTPDVDAYTVNLTGQVGKKLDIVLAGIGNDFSNQQLQLIGTDGSTVLATGVIDPVQSGTNATNMDLAILGFTVPADGIFTVRVSSSTTSGRYQLIIANSLVSDAEPNNLSTDPLRAVAMGQPALGFLSASADQDDRYSVSLVAGESVTINTATPFDSASAAQINSLNPELMVFQPNGTSLISDLDTVDGKNARVVFTAPVSGIYSVRARATAGVGEYLLEISNVQASTPQISSFVFGDGTTQRSMVNRITIDFSTVVVIANSGAFVLDRRDDTTGTWGSISTAQLNVGFSSVLFNNNSQSRAILSFAGSEVIGGSLADGNYRLTIIDSLVTANSIALDGDGNGTVGGNFVRGTLATDNFFRLFGDSDGNGAVNIVEFNQFRAAFGSNVGGASYDARFDFDSAGGITIFEFNEFRKRFGRNRNF